MNSQITKCPFCDGNMPIARIGTNRLECSACNNTGLTVHTEQFRPATREELNEYFKGSQGGLINSIVRS